MSDHTRHPKRPAAESASELRAARQRAGLSLDALAAKAGVAKGTLHAAEVDPTKLSDRTAAAVAAALSVPKSQLRSKMSLPAIDVSSTTPWVRAAAKKLPEGHPARTQVLETLEAYRRIAASTGVLGAAPNPEDPGAVANVLLLVFGAKRRRLDSGAILATTERGRQYVLCEHPDDLLAIMLEIEWRLARENVELEVFARPPEVVQ